MIDHVTPLILTLNEAPNIGRTLGCLSWAKDLVVVDSFSSDDTLPIIGRYPTARIFQRKFDDHAQQWNFGLRETSIATDWVLALDADYILTDDFQRELEALAPAADVAGYRVRFRYCIEGRPLRGAAYTPVTVLYRRSCAEYVQDGHTQRVRLNGKVLDFQNPILHDDRKSLQQWLSAQNRYMKIEAEHLRRQRYSELPIQDKIRRLIVIAPVVMFFYCMVVKGNILDGRAGLFYALQRTVAEGILSLYLLQSLLSSDQSAK